MRCIAFAFHFISVCVQSSTSNPAILSGDPLAPAPSASHAVEADPQSRTVPPADNSQSFQEVGAAPDKMDVPYTRQEAEEKGAAIGRSIGLGIRHAGEAVKEAVESAAHAVGIGHADSDEASKDANASAPTSQ